MNGDALLQIIREFLSRCRRVELTPEIIERTIRIRRSRNIKTPDAVIAATALVLGVTLVSADRQFEGIAGLQLAGDLLG